jgi:hypothetical protein
MPSLFEDRRTEAGRGAIQDLIDHISSQPKQTIRSAPGEGIDVSKCRWVPSFAHFLMGEHETALSLAHRYLSESEEIRGENAQEIAHGIFLLYLIYGALHEFKE